MELINYRLYVEFVLPLFKGKTYDQNLTVLMVRLLANVIHLTQKLIKNEENAKKQQELKQEKKLSELAMSAND